MWFYNDLNDDKLTLNTVSKLFSARATWKGPKSQQSHCLQPRSFNMYSISGIRYPDRPYQDQWEERSESKVNGGDRILGMLLVPTGPLIASPCEWVIWPQDRDMSGSQMDREMDEGHAWR